MGNFNKGLRWAGLAISAYVLLEEVSYFLQHHRVGPSLVIALLALSVLLIVVSDLLRDRE